ncbi:rhodanese-like domain-containing protein [Magnetococcus sp. PR-3]|uniref:rhodanese-like domain-containing protein n=1 Tax=Magnetococcus sp. PR-3 TaxID=3120355 RepID=UPI002FCE04D6
MSRAVVRLLFVGLLCVGTPFMFWPAQADAMEGEERELMIDVMNDYMSESTHTQGMVTPEQVQVSYLGVAQILDTREAEQYEQSHIPDALHMEWREVLDRLDEIATDKPVVLYCGTGALSAQAGFALRVLGYSNVVIMRGGYRDWLKLVAPSMK